MSYARKRFEGLNRTDAMGFYGMEALFKDGCGNWFSLTEHVQDPK
jgi:hypothetical protein